MRAAAALANKCAQPWSTQLLHHRQDPYSVVCYTPCQVPPEFMPHLPLLKSLGTRDAPSPQDLLSLLASLHKPHATQPLTSVQLR